MSVSITGGVSKRDENMSRLRRSFQAGLVCGCLILLMIVKEAPCTQIRAGITPSTPSAFETKNLSMNCTLEGAAASDVSARNLSFSSTNTELNAKSVTRIVNNRTISLVIPKVYRNMSSSRVSCRLGNDTLDEVAIVVDVPQFPSAPDCVVYNWVTMNCTWETVENDNTNISLIYSRSKCQGNKYLCRHAFQEGGRSGCTWREREPNGDIFMLVDHCLYYRATNSFNAMAHSSPLYTIEVENIVKPNPVKNGSINVSSNYVDLSWSSPSPVKKLQYRVAYESRFSNITIQNTTSTSIRLTNLIPNTMYTIRIDCIPVGRKGVVAGFWSDELTIEVTTEPVVPGDSPPVTPGGFSVIEHNVSHRNIKLFFQPVDVIRSHGEVKGYRVRYSRGNSTAELEVADLKTIAVDLPLEMERTYAVSMAMKNVMGYNESLTPQVIVIGRQSELPPFPKNFVVQTDDKGSYMLHWTPVDHASSYTLYWCNSSLRLFECHNPLNWKVLPADRTSEVLQLVRFPGLTVRFAISVENVTASKETVSSGMLIANCTYSLNKELKPPEDVVLAQPDRNTISVHLSRPDRTTSLDKCAEVAYASHYRISYCPKNHCEESEKSVTVESFQDSVLIDGLEESETYEVRVESLSENGSSSIAALVKEITVEMMAAESNEVPVPLIVVLALISVAICAIPGVVKLVCWWKKKWHIEVKTPPKYVNNALNIAGEDNGYSNYLRSDLHSNGQVQTSVCKSGRNNGRPPLYSNSDVFQPSEEESLLLKHNLDYKSSTSSSQTSPVLSVPSSITSSQFSDTHHDSGISRISEYNLVIEQPCGNSGASPDCSGSSVPQDDVFITVGEKLPPHD